MSHVDAAALTLVGMACVTTVVLFVLRALRHRKGTAKGRAADGASQRG